MSASHFLSFFSKALSNYSFFFFFFTKTKNQHNTKAKFNSIPPSTTTLFCLVYIPKKKKKKHTHKIRTLRARPSTPLSLSSLWGSPLSLSLSLSKISLLLLLLGCEFIRRSLLSPFSGTLSLTSISLYKSDLCVPILENRNAAFCVLLVLVKI